MNPLRVPFALTTATVVGLVIALVATGPMKAVGVALASTPLVAVLVSFRRRAVPSSRRPDTERA